MVKEDLICCSARAFVSPKGRCAEPPRCALPSARLLFRIFALLTSGIDAKATKLAARHLASAIGEAR